MIIGLLGGSFNPIHNGHIKIAQAVIESRSVHQIWFIPSYIHPLKDHKGNADFNQRLGLIKKAIIDFPDLKVQDFEKRSSDPSYTQKLMQFLHKSYPQHEFIFIIGYDIIPELNRWYKYDWLNDNIEFLIVTRTIDQDISLARDLKHRQFLNIPPIDISSTQIRELITQGKSIHGLVPENVESEIHKIYSRTKSTSP
ncbi:MAG: nicotinate (nicotinamide) nucleotide adenylyltransferase [Candidatus Stygibacter frigidus]|nr:nicotinate (nicotinamide) nucleotide adenylyltransferase [Candidatus Stygibacter frigidus]